VRPRLETWQAFWRQSPGARVVALEAAVVLVATWVGLRLAGFRRSKDLLVRLAPATPAERIGNLDAARAIACLHESVARGLFLKTNCLEQSLALCWLLRRRGIAAELCVGARKQDGKFEAHAWVETQGAVVCESDERHRFVPFDGAVISTGADTSLESQTH
jgi:Transglutaminase-like superfamily